MTCNGLEGKPIDPFRPPVQRSGTGYLPGEVPSLESVVYGVLGHESLRRALILKLLLLYREELAEVGEAFTERVRGYVEGSLRPWAEPAAMEANTGAREARDLHIR